MFAQFHKHCVVELTTQLFTFTKEYAPSISACFFTIKIVFQKDKHLIHFVTLLRFVWTHSWIRVLAGCGAILGTFSKPRRRRQRGRGKWAIVLSREFQDYTTIVWIKNTVFILALNLTCHCYVQITGGEKTSTLSHCSKYSRNIYRYYTKSDFKILYTTLKKRNWVAHELLRHYISRCLVL